MKKYSASILLSVCMLGFCFVRSQDLTEGKVPKMVTEAFKKKYPNTFAYEWEWKKREQLYEAEFMRNGDKYEARFSKEGNWVSTTREINTQQLPKSVMDAIHQSEYSSWRLDDIEEHSTPQQEQMYLIEVEKGKRNVYLYMMPDGKMVKTSTKK
ncbi:MAG: PepSY-like domain-containing protein [Bacteroidetes bacterium]|nr:PepSY-like domain-containing protein [Bacteroidota bacterium]